MVAEIGEEKKFRCSDGHEEVWRMEYDDDMKDEVYESYVSSVSFYKCGEQYRIYDKATKHFIGAYFRECDFGKTVFLTKSEAEEKLKELRGGEND